MVRGPSRTSQLGAKTLTCRLAPPSEKSLLILGFRILPSNWPLTDSLHPSTLLPSEIPSSEPATYLPSTYRGSGHWDGNMWEASHCWGHLKGRCLVLGWPWRHLKTTSSCWCPNTHFHTCSPAFLQLFLILKLPHAWVRPIFWQPCATSCPAG